MSNVADSMSVEAQIKRLWKWVGELSIENDEMKKANQKNKVSKPAINPRFKR